MLRDHVRLGAVLSGCLLWALAVTGPAIAGEKELLELLESKGIINSQEAADLLRRPETAPEVKKTDALPAWVGRIRLGGDLRLRYQGDSFGPTNALFLRPDKPTELLNSTEDRHRFRYRARLSLNARVNDQVEAGFRLATGTESDPVSTNETLGDAFNKDGITFDQAYLKWQPAPAFTLWGGRFPNPWFSSDLVWDGDLNFEGVAATWKGSLAGPLGFFATAGAFPLEEVEFSNKDKWLFGGQAGVQVQPAQGLSGKLGVAYYLFQDITGELNDPDRPGETDFTAPRFQQKGNTLFDIDPDINGIKAALAAEFRLLDIMASADVGIWDPIHIFLMADYVKNLGFDRDDVARRTGIADVAEETEGLQAGVAVGYPQVRDRLEWKGYLFYKRLEADAVVDAFTDSDFHLGGTNAKGWTLGGEVGLAKNLWLTARWLTADEIAGPPLAIDVLQLDLNASF